MSPFVCFFYIILCLTIIISISIMVTQKQLETFMNHSPYSKTKTSKIGEIDFLGASKFSPECCPHTYTSSSGCLCNTQNENIMISSRGGNKCCC